MYHDVLDRFISRHPMDFYEQEALLHVNAIRQEWNLPDLSRLPKGHAAATQQCTIALALSDLKVIDASMLVAVNSMETALYSAGPEKLKVYRHDLPVRVFVERFDVGSYKHLVIK